MTGHGRPRAADPRRALGARGEALAAAWYERRGYAVLDRNWRRREGELDLVLGRAGLVVFCEVKTRSSHAFGAPVEAITREKRRRIRLLASQWLAQCGTSGVELRFDVASVLAPPGAVPVLEILEGAF